MEWTREKRYRKLEDITDEEYNRILGTVEQCKFRQKYHIQPISGLLNDPNGFSFYNGEYHLFYQWFPLGPVHGIKYWYHVSSYDLVHWKDCGIALDPEKYYESHGVFSGTGFVKDNNLYLFYTGNTRNDKWERKPYQCLAIMDSNGKISKYEKPLICDSPEAYTDNFRDPKVFEQNGIYYCLIGAETKEHIGALAYYNSNDLINWNYIGNLNIPYKEGFMLECPDYFELEDKGIFIFCAQGQKPIDDNFNNIFPAGYMIGNKVDFSQPNIMLDDYKELDRGFDFYAPQTMLDANGRRILIGWMGLPGIECVTEKSNWAHCMTLPRELKIIDGKLYQSPIKELETIRNNKREVETVLKGEKTFSEIRGSVYNLECSFSNIKSNEVGIKLRVGDNEETVFYLDRINNKLILDRSKSGILYATEYGTVRKCDFDCEKLNLQIYVDTSSIEIFVNDGLEVFTTRIYTADESQGIVFFSDEEVSLKAVIWDLEV